MNVFCVSFVFTAQIEFSECCVWFQWFTQWCCSRVSNAVVCWREEKGKEWFADECLLCVFFLLSSLLKLSWVSVVFDFNDSLNDVIPVSPIRFPVDVKRKEKNDLLMDVFYVSSFFCLHHTNQVEWVLCLISMLHSMRLLLLPRCCSLLMRRERRKSELLMDAFFVSFFCLHNSDWVQWVLCLFSVIHSMTLLLFL